MSDPRPPRWLKPVNKIMMAVQRLGISAGPAMVLTVPGRRSGQPRSTPITPFMLGGHLYSVAGYTGADWPRNARAAGEGTLTRGRRSQRVKIVELTAEEARPVLRAFPANVPVGVSFAKRSGLVGEGTPDEFEALAGRCYVFRFDTLSSTAWPSPKSRQRRSGDLVAGGDAGRGSEPLGRTWRRTPWSDPASSAGR